MTHLEIELNGITEEVSSSVITKLYEIVTNDSLDETSNLTGRLNTTATYLDYIDTLHTEYPGLYITANKYYLSFADPEVTRIMSSLFSLDGVGITLSDLLSITTLNNAFLNNTTIEYFDDFNRLSGISLLKCYDFYGCTNLKSINLSRITTIETDGGMERNWTFEGCSSLTKVVAPLLTEISGNMFRGCTNLKIFIAPVLTNCRRTDYPFDNVSLKALITPSLYLDAGGIFSFSGDTYHPNGFIGYSSSLVLFELKQALYINKQALKNLSSLRAVVLHGDNMVLLNGWTSGNSLTEWFPNTSITIYVKDSLLSTYQSDTAWSGYYSEHIKGISEYNPADYLDSDLLLTYNEAMGTSYTAS